jgi:hypothetical protein
VVKPQHFSVTRNAVRQVTHPGSWCAAARNNREGIPRLQQAMSGFRQLNTGRCCGGSPCTLRCVTVHQLLYLQAGSQVAHQF